MAVPAELGPNQSSDLESVRPTPDAVMEKAAELYGSGYSRTQIARMMVKWLDTTSERPMEARIRQARAKLRRWEKKPEFRDLVWDKAVVDLDMAGPEILRGVARIAKKGRVDAAKLALSITGRHKDRDDNRPSAIQINIGSMPRPTRQAVEAPADITIEPIDED